MGLEIDSIAEVGIDEQERIYVRPSVATFPFIYREAIEVHWEPVRHYLYSPKPREWTYLKWFQHVIHAAALQSSDLRLTPSTVWTNVPEELRAEIQGWFSSQTPKLP
jgi:hypothetical protein